MLVCEFDSEHSSKVFGAVWMVSHPATTFLLSCDWSVLLSKYYAVHVSYRDQKT